MFKLDASNLVALEAGLATRARFAQTAYVQYQSDVLASLDAMTSKTQSL